MAEDPHVALERLHSKWSAATDEVESIMAEWRKKWGDNKLKDRYYVAQDKAVKLVQEIMAHKRKYGV
jgi:hypothetical protein